MGIHINKGNIGYLSLAGFARAGKGYVDCMIYGGEEAAAEYAKTYDAAANADADGDGNADGDAQSDLQ